jgi:hypothetical protein
MAQLYVPYGAEVGDARELAMPLRTQDDLDAVLERVGSARHVLIGEASHGTSEYDEWRAALHPIQAVAVGAIAEPPETFPWGR